MDRFEDKPNVRVGVFIEFRIEFRHHEREAEFEGHVEPWSSWVSSIQLDSRQIVYGVFAAPDQRQYFVRTIAPALDFECSSGSETKMGQANDVSEKETPKFVVVWDVQEDLLVGLWKLGHHPSLP
jgi:hypothetical protein